MKRLRDIVWWFRHRLDPRHRYHVIRTGLRPGYYDPDTRLTFAVLEVVKEFRDEVELVDWDNDDGHRQAWDSICAAAEWWRKNREHFADHFVRLGLDEERRVLVELTEHFAAIGKALHYMWYP